MGTPFLGSHISGLGSARTSQPLHLDGGHRLYVSAMEKRILASIGEKAGDRPSPSLPSSKPFWDPILVGR